MSALTGDPCGNCERDYDECTALVLGPEGRACCGSCGYADTHNERPGTEQVDATGPAITARRAFEEALEDAWTDAEQVAGDRLVITYEQFIKAWRKVVGLDSEATK